jgi:hypothetical protein
MDSHRHKTYKRAVSYESKELDRSDPLRSILEEGAKDAYSRQWHRIERGLRLNRLRLFIEEISPNYSMSKEEKDQLFIYLQKALDKKLLNTLKVVQYDTATQRILSIKGLDMKRNEETGQLQYELNSKKPKETGTRKRRKDDVPSVSVSSVEASSPESVI